MKPTVRAFWKFFAWGLGAFLLLIFLANVGLFGKMPSLYELQNPSILQASEVYGLDGTLMGKYYTERGNRSNVKYRDLSRYAIDALVATEDERFYSHSGIDFKSTLRALVTLGSEGGGSTITQQLAKALLAQGSRNKAWRVIEKLKEWIIAVKLEKNFTKEEILTLYLNAVPFGNNIYGIRNASRTFFQKEPDRLTVEEAALLIGMLKGNSIYNPVRNPKAALDRRNVVIGQMEVNNKITAEEATQLKAMPIQLNYKKMDENTGYAPYFREILKEEIKEALKGLTNAEGDPYSIYNDGLKIYTTINVQMQQYAEEALAQHMSQLQKNVNNRNSVKSGKIWQGKEAILERAIKESDRWRNLEEDGWSEKEIRASFTTPVPMKVFAWNSKREVDTVMTPLDSIKYHRQMEQASFMAIDPVTGEIRAWVGGINFKTFKYDHVNIKTKRQVGSTIKPLLYTQAVEERGFTPETQLPNEPQYFEGNGWVPASKECKGGPGSMAAALAFSKNCATAYVMKQVGARQFSEFMGRLNIPTPIGPYPSVALGSCDLSLFEMMWAYTIFSGRGFSTKPFAISRIEDRNGNVIKRFDFSANRKEVISEATAYTMARMMQGAVDVGTAAGMRSRVGAAEMGGKTGTTNENADAWFLGFTPQILVGSWVGFDDQFIRNEGEASRMARPICEFFLGKALSDAKTGLDRDARFIVPAEMTNGVNSADILLNDLEMTPGAQGQDVGVGTEEDYKIESTEYIGPESKPVREEDSKPALPAKKDSIPKKEAETTKPVSNGTDGPEKKKGIINRILNRNG
jgi:penicillin-binding protein 1A